MPPDSSRKTKHENLLKVQDMLQRDETFYAELNLKNGCLKSMTTNQFYMMINHFVRLICGKELDTFIQNGDPLHGIMNFMTQVDYPYTVNKSMLKTPNAPHTFDQVVVMLLWLGNVSSIPFIAADDTMIENFLNTHDEHLPNEEFTAMFSKAIQEGYHLWNSESDEHAQFIDRLTDGLVGSKLNHKVASVAELGELTEKLKKKSKELAENPVQLNNLHQFEQLESKYIEYETMEHDLTNQLKEKRDRLAAINVSYTDKRTKVQQFNEKVNELADQIHNQAHTIDDFRKLGQEVSSLKTAATAIRDEVKAIRDEESNQSILKARLLKRVAEAITSINNRCVQIAKSINSSRLVVNIEDLNKLCLSANPTVDEVNALEQRLLHMFSTVTIHMHQIQMIVDQKSSKLNVLNEQRELLGKEYEVMKKKHEKAVFEHEMQEKKSIMKRKKHDNCARDKTKQIEDAKAHFEAVNAQIAVAKDKQKQLQQRNEELMRDFEERAMKIQEEKQHIHNHLSELEQMVNGSLEGFDYPH